MSQFAGWPAQRYHINRPVSDYEKIADLRKIDSSSVTPIDQGIIALNDVYMEYVDRHFLYRGWAAMWGTLAVLIPLALAWFMAFTPTETATGEVRSLTSGEQLGVAFVVLMALATAVFAYWFTLGRDIFRYQYYPVRFNRLSRRVHIFTGGARGALSVPWDDIHFVIGRDKPFGPGGVYTYDLRGHVIENGRVVHTFAVGSDGGANPGVVLAQWEMIRRFMESGRSALPFPPLQLFTSVSPSLRNAFIIHVSSAGSGMMVVALPITLPWTLSRYLTMKLCRRPRWPDSVQADCQPGNGLPGALKAPEVYGRVAHGADSEAMAVFWQRAIQDAKALNPGLLTRLDGGATVDKAPGDSADP